MAHFTIIDGERVRVPPEVARDAERLAVWVGEHQPVELAYAPADEGDGDDVEHEDD